MPPFRLLLVTTALVILVLPYTNSMVEFGEGFNESMKNEEVQEIMVSLLTTYANLWLCIFIPIAGAITWLLNRKSGLNYAENLVFHTYFFCIANIISLFMVFDGVVGNMVVAAYATFIPVAYFIYAYSAFFGKTTLRALGEGLLTYFIAAIFYGIVLVGLLIGIVGLIMKFKSA